MKKMMVVIFVLFTAAFAQRGAITEMDVLQRLYDYQEIEASGQYGDRLRAFSVNVKNGDRLIPVYAYFEGQSEKPLVEFGEVELTYGDQLEQRFYGAAFILGLLGKSCFSTEFQGKIGTWIQEKILSVKAGQYVQFVKKFGAMNVEISVTRYVNLNIGALWVGFYRDDKPGTPAWPHYCVFAK